MKKMIAYFDKTFPGTLSDFISQLINKHKYYVLENESMIRLYDTMTS